MLEIQASPQSRFIPDRSCSFISSSVRCFSGSSSGAWAALAALIHALASEVLRREGG